MDDCVVEIDEIIIDIEDNIISGGDSSDFMNTLFKKDKNLKMVLSKSLKHLSYRFKNFKWDIMVFIENNKSNVEFFLATSFGMEKYYLCFFKNKSYENKYFRMPKKELNLSNVNKIEEKFCHYLNDNYLYIKEEAYVGNNKVRNFLRAKHDKNIEIFKYVDKIFDYKYSYILNGCIIEYTIGEKFFVYDDFDKLLSEDNISCKSVLKNLFSKGVFSANITEAQFESMLESDDVEDIVENIKLITY